MSAVLIARRQDQAVAGRSKQIDGRRMGCRHPVLSLAINRHGEGRRLMAGAAERLAKESWWAKLRKRGMVVAFTTIIGGIGTVVGTVVAVFTWLGWTPWS